MRIARAFSLLRCTGKSGEVRLFLRKSRNGSSCSVNTRSEIASRTRYFGGKRKTPRRCVHLPSFTKRSFRNVLAVVLSCASVAYGSDLPEAPEPLHSEVMTRTSFLLAGGLVASRALDWASTQECLRRSWCHEGELPNALVHSKPGLAAFEASMSALGIFAQHEMGKHGHRKLAIVGQVVCSSMILGQDAYNYYVDKSYPRHP